MKLHNRRLLYWLSGIILGALILAGCGAATSSTIATGQSSEASNGATTPENPTTAGNTLPELSPLALNGRKLRVLATTNIVGNVVAQIGGDDIDLTTLLAPGVDPHSYQLAPSDRQKLEDADVIFINGLGLEEGMLPVLDELDNKVPLVPVSAGISTIEFGEHQQGTDGPPDPHSWQSVQNVVTWTHNISATLSALDPAHAGDYGATASAYTSQLEILNIDLHTLADSLPREQRKLVTDHDSLGYFAQEYGFDIIGTVIPSLSTDATSSAQDLAALEDQIRKEGVKAIFVGTTVNPQLAQQLAADLGIKVASIYSDSLSDANGPAATYLDFMRNNMQTIVDALK